MVLKWSLTSPLGWIQQVGAPGTAAKSVSLLLWVSDLGTSLYFINTNIHKELKPQVNVSHMNSPAITLYTQPWASEGGQKGSLAPSGAPRNFIREGPITWHSSNCSFRLFRNSRNWFKAPMKNLSKFVSGRTMVSSASL